MPPRKKKTPADAIEAVVAPSSPLGAGDRHKPRKIVGIVGAFIGPGDRLAARMGMTFAQVANIAFREFLERQEMWPPTPMPTGQEKGKS